MVDFISMELFHQIVFGLIQFWLKLSSFYNTILEIEISHSKKLLHQTHYLFKISLLNCKMVHIIETSV